MDSKLNFNIKLNSYICPNCHVGSFRDHYMAEFSREWSKCSCCGYMERKAITEARILSILDPDQLSEPFIDPLSDITNVTINSKTNCKNIHKKDNYCNCADCTSSK